MDANGQYLLQDMVRLQYGGSIRPDEVRVKAQQVLMRFTPEQLQAEAILLGHRIEVKEVLVRVDV